MAKEIERKFLLSEIPSHLVPTEERMVYQNYLSVKKDEEIRIRLEEKNGERKCDVTYKRGNGLVREEVKFNISESMYFDLSSLIKENPIKKFRQFFQLGEHELMVDTYLETKEPLIVAEIEFESEEAANKFVPPSWFGQEVTDDHNFKNKNLWKKLQ